MSSLHTIKGEFPALAQKVHGKPLIYLDSAATALKPRSVIDAIVSVYQEDAGNIHRAVHTLSQRATTRFEQARELVSKFINAPEESECIFTRGTTESINLVAFSWGRQHLKSGDSIVVSGLEHHSNIVPWQILCKETGATLKVAPIKDNGDITLEEFDSVIDKSTKLVVCAHASNALGTVLPIESIAKLAHENGALCLVDGAQAAPHMQVDVAKLGCDFYAFSGHKLYGPSGIGVLWGKREVLEKMTPFHGGGDMIKNVSFENTTFAEIPAKFEAGTPHIAGAIGLGAAVEFVQKIGFKEISSHEEELRSYGTKKLLEIDGLTIHGTAPNKIGVLTFTTEWGHPQDVGSLLDSMGVAVRTGHHCAEPLMHRLGLNGTSRASMGMYNNRSDIDVLCEGLLKAKAMLS